MRGIGICRKLLLELRHSRIIRGRSDLIVRRERLGRHETNRCCTAGMTAKSTVVLEPPGLAYAISTRPAKLLALACRDDELTGSIVGRDLVKERVAQALGIRIPLSRSLVGGQRRRPERVRAVVAMHRQVESIREEQFRPFPPGAELLHPAQQVVAVDQRRRHVRGHRSEQEARVHDAVQLANSATYLLFRDMAQAGLEYEIEFAVLERHIDDRPKLVELL